MQTKDEKKIFFFVSLASLLYSYLSPFYFSFIINTQQHNNMDNSNALLITILVAAILVVAVIILIISCWFIRKRRKYNQSQLLFNFSVTEGTHLLTARSSQSNTERTQTEDRSILLTCHFYIRTTGEYTFHSQLSQLGFNAEKNWFLLTHPSKTNTLSNNAGSHLLTIQPKSDRLNQLDDEESTATYIKNLNNLFTRLFHPYIEPINKLDILYAQKLVVAIKQYQRLGSLKDVIQGVTPTTPYEVNK
jgi:hypothetical protein